MMTSSTTVHLSSFQTQPKNLLKIENKLKKTRMSLKGSISPTFFAKQKVNDAKKFAHQFHQQLKLQILSLHWQIFQQPVFTVCPISASKSFSYCSSKKATN